MEPKCPHGGSELTAQGNSHPGPGTLVLEEGAAEGVLSRVFRSWMRWLGTVGTYLPWASNRSRCSCYICQPPRLAWPSPEDAPSPWSLWVLFPCLAAALLSFFPPTPGVEDICSCLVFPDQGSATHSLTSRPVFAEQSHSFFHPLCLSSSSPSHHHLHPHHSLQGTCLLPVDDLYSIPLSETPVNAVTTGEAPQHAHVAGGCRPGICHRPPRRPSRRPRRWRDRWRLGTSASGCRHERRRQERRQAPQRHTHRPGPSQEGLFRPPIWISALRDIVLVE